MKEIYDTYHQLCNTVSDINEHLPVLKRYAEECEHVTEMGVRWVTSTWAFLAAKPKAVVCYDIARHPNVSKAVKAAANCNISFKFILADVLKVDIEPTDLLFIDTLHTYEQLKLELALHARNVNKYLIFHDTVTFGKIGEKLYDHASNLVKGSVSGKGIGYAIEEFLSANPQWKVKEVLENNNGLTVLEKSE